MSRFPEEVKYSLQHVWLRMSDGREVRLGATDYWAESLGTIVHVDLPLVGIEVQAGDRLGELVGPATSEPLMAPISGVVSAVNHAVLDQPDLVRSESYGNGWLLEIELSADVDTAELSLLDAEGYEELVQQ